MDHSNLFTATNTDIARKYWLAIGLVTGVLTGINVISKISTRLRLKAASRNHPSPTTPSNFLHQIYATITALFREATLPSIPTISNNDLWAMFTPPPLGRLIAIGLYMITIVLMLTINVYTSGYWYYEKIGYRAAWVSITQIPFVLLISGRASVFSLLTSIPAERINFLHRWVGRVILVCVLLHMSFFVHPWLLIDFLQTELEIMPMVRYGFGALGVLGWIAISSAAPVRYFAYEVFYLNHLASVGALLWCLYMHVPAKAMYNVWLAIAFLAFDRVVRAAWWFYINIHRNPSTTGGEKPKYGLKFGHTTEVEILGRKEHLTRVVIKDVKIKWKAGQHIYLSVPSLRPIEAHPFSISNAYEDSVPDGSTNEYQELGRTKFARSDKKRDLHLLIRSRAGFSSQLHKKCQPGANAPVLLTAFIDGPYGTPPEWRTFETVVLIGTSTGITFILPVLEDIAAYPGCVRRVHFHWTVRHVSDLKLLTRRLARLAGRCKERGVEVLLNVSVTCSAMKKAREGLDSEAERITSGDSKDSKSTDNSGTGLLSSGEKKSCCAGKDELEITSVTLPDIARPSCCSNKPSIASTKKEESFELEKVTEEKISRIESSTSSATNSSGSSDSTEADGAVCCCSTGTAAGAGSCCTTVCTCGFSSDSLSFSCGRPSVEKMIRPPVEAAEGETVVACCANRRLMDEVRNFVGKISDERAVHKGSGAQGILCWTEGFY